VKRDPVLKTFLLTEVNHHVRDLAVEADSDAPEWEFFCECGEKGCREQLKLTLAEYVALSDSGNAVLAPGHRLSQVERARRLREDAAALMAQAQHQVQRTQRIVRTKKAPE
jgi:hypothetical protein